MFKSGHIQHNKLLLLAVVFNNLAYMPEGPYLKEETFHHIFLETACGFLLLQDAPDQSHYAEM